MKKILSTLPLIVLSGAVGASTIEYQTGHYTSSSTFASAIDYQVAVDSAVMLSPSVTLTSYDNVNPGLSQSGNDAFKATVNFDVANVGMWSIRSGVDFGLGGAMFLDGVAQTFKTNDMWWAGNYGNPSQYLSFSNALTAGNHTLTIYGLEWCCSGPQQAQFESESSNGFVSFSNADGLVSSVPEPEAYALMLVGLGLIGTVINRRKSKAG